MTNTTQHHHVTLTPRADQIEAARDLLVRCAAQVALKQSEGGPTSWCAIFDESRKVFLVEALFPSQEAVAFHQANIQGLLKEFGPMMAAPPETIIQPVFAAV